MAKYYDRGITAFSVEWFSPIEFLDVDIPDVILHSYSSFILIFRIADIFFSLAKASGEGMGAEPAQLRANAGRRIGPRRLRAWPLAYHHVALLAVLHQALLRTFID